VGELVGALVQLRIGQLAVLENHGRPLGQPVSRAGQEFRQRPIRNRHCSWRGMVVGLEPGPAQLCGVAACLPPGDLWHIGQDEPLDGAVDRLMALQLNLVLGRAHIHPLGAGNCPGYLLDHLTGKIGVAFAGDDQRRRAQRAHQSPAAPLQHVVVGHAFHHMQLGIPARPVIPDRPQQRGGQAVGQGHQSWHRIFSGRGHQHQMGDLLGVDAGILHTDRPTEGVTDQVKLRGQIQVLADGVQIGDQLRHRVARVRRVALAMPAQVRGHHTEIFGEVVDLALPGLRAARVAMDEDDGTLHPLRANVDHAELIAGDARHRDIDPIHVEIELNVAALDASKFTFHSAQSLPQPALLGNHRNDGSHDPQNLPPAVWPRVFIAPQLFI
jgi:hypothetical protein